VDERAIETSTETRRDTVSEDQDKRTDEAEVEDEDFEGHSFGGGSGEPRSHGGGAEPESHGGGAEPESHGGGAEPENHGGGV
jgi:hypothetical protein